MARSIRLTQDEVATAAQLAGVPPALALAIWRQESDSGRITKTSAKGAVGGFQITPATFKDYGSGDINDPVDNMHAGLAVLADGLRKSGGDWEGAAQRYYHGSVLPAGVEGPTSGPGTPTTRQYGKQVVAKALKIQADENLPEVEFKQPVYRPPGRGLLPPSSNDFGLPPNNPYFMDEQIQKPYNTDEEGNMDFQGDEEDQDEENPIAGQLQAILGTHNNIPGYGGSQNTTSYDRFDPSVNMIGSRNYDMDKYIRRLVDEEFANT